MHRHTHTHTHRGKGLFLAAVNLWHFWSTEQGLRDSLQITNFIIAVVALTMLKDDSQTITKQIHYVFRKTIQFVHDVMHLWRQESRKQTCKILTRINQLSHGVASVVKYHVRLFSWQKENSWDSFTRHRVSRTCVNASLLQYLKPIFLPVFDIVSFLP